MFDKTWRQILAIFGLSAVWMTIVMVRKADRLDLNAYLAYYSWGETPASGNTSDSLPRTGQEFPGPPPGASPLEDVLNHSNCPADPTKDNKLMFTSLDYLLTGGLNKSIAMGINGTGPVDKYLSDYRNPCWLERLPQNFSYSRSIYRDAWPAPSQRKGVIMAQKKSLLLFRQRLSEGNGWRIRCLPYLFIVGMYKAGTTDFYNSLTSHKLIERIGIKEPYFWTNLPSKVLDPGFRPIKKYGMATFENYLDLYDEVAEKIRTYPTSGSFHPKITVDAATWTFSGYKQWMYHPWNRGAGEMCVSLPQHISYMSPHSHVVLLFREPVSWLASCINHHKRIYSTTRNNTERPRPVNINQHIIEGIRWFEECAAKNKDRERNCFYDRETASDLCHVKFMVYFIIVKEWADAIGKNKMLVINSNDYYSDRVPVIDRTLRFLNLPLLDGETARNMRKKSVANAKSHSRGRVNILVKQTTIDALNKFLKPWNEKLARFLGDESFLWSGIKGFRTK